MYKKETTYYFLCKKLTKSFLFPILGNFCYTFLPKKWLRFFLSWFPALKPNSKNAGWWEQQHTTNERNYSNWEVRYTLIWISLSKSQKTIFKPWSSFIKLGFSIEWHSPNSRCLITMDIWNILTSRHSSERLKTRIKRVKKKPDWLLE